MKLSTDVRVRSDGTVRVQGEDGKSYVFKGDPLECEITDVPTLQRLLQLGTFFPVTEAGEKEAVKLLGAINANKAPADDDGDEDAADPNALPIEANTPPKVEPVAQAASGQQRRTRTAA